MTLTHFVQFLPLLMTPLRIYSSFPPLGIGGSLLTIAEENHHAPIHADDL